MRDRVKRPRSSIVGILAVALAVRLLHVWQIRRSPFFDVLFGDARSYDAWAQRIAAGDWVGRDVFYQAPLYPYFLGAVYSIGGRSLLAVRVLQAILGSISCVLVALAGERFFSSRAGIIAGFGLALYAPAIFFDGLIQKSTLDLFFLALSLWLLACASDSPQRRWTWVALGASLGGLALTRENALVFIVVVAVWILWPARQPRAGSSLTPVAAYALGLAVVLLPVAVRNYAVSGGFYLTTMQFGPNFYIGNNPRADGTYAPLRYGRGAPEYERRDSTDLAEHALGRNLTPAEVSSFWTDRALAFITSEPLAWLKLEARKLLLLVNATEMLDTESQESYAEWSWPLRALGWFGHFGVLVPIAAAGAILAWPIRRRLAILYAMTAAYAASVLLFYVFARYRLPLVPLLMLFAGHAIAVVVGSRFRWTAHPRFAVAALGLTAVAANWPLLSPRLMQAITETNLGSALQEDGKTTEAIERYRHALAIAPDYAPALNNLGVALRAAGSVDAAISAYEQALAINADYPDAHYNLANALLDKHQPEEARKHFEIALRSIPDSAGVRNNLGVALAAAGRPEDAVAAFRAAVADDPDSANAHRNLGDALTAAGEMEEGVAELRRAAALAPNDAAAHYDLGSALIERGNLDEAVTELRAALRLAPRSVEAHNNLGIALGSQGHFDAAIAEFRAALAIDQDSADAKRNLELAEKARGRR